MAREGSLRRSTSVLTRARRLGRKILRWLEGDSRSQQLRDEVLFWRHWFSTQGSFWPEDYKERLDPNLPIQDHVGRYVDRLTTNPVSILDVGAGPLTKLGKVHASKEIMITATDLLATEYDQVLRDFGIQPLVRTVFGDAENLSTQFGDYSFDIVHGQNCIDHTASPLKAIQQMLSVTKHDGFVVLYHAENEGKTESYKQLHKWDFTCEKGHFVIRGPGPGGDSVDATDALAAVGSVECSLDDGAVLVAIRKHPQRLSSTNC
ncbi:methyltransferase domain-containing protein [Mesorhizobium sp. M5C.F.Ca.IN.020.29.1.1]|uniref:class I SAM-dependent methyltransferase n=1 Tax=unclassified Mesorhizobium TaxID=325217 RepID=UPI000FC9DC4D|nr:MULTISPECIES: methyltransferase domain-containing protein [unclassified Mesorhizobium]RUV48173.1 methyltransferase domain-containing protein [Mesorhizobium sp. M5C.F.Ca.IN.020.29.1.1]TIM84012.1 MAG: class I SAM-dependent methyltransferase [Mesorhizobium sp.]